MFAQLGEKIRNLAQGWQKTALLKEKDVIRALADIRLALLEADVSLPTVERFVANMRTRLDGAQKEHSLTAHQSIIQSVFEEIKVTLGHSESLQYASPLSVFTLLGLQGVGKTTTTAKLALHLKNNASKKVLLVSTDVHRPAARKQLAMLGEQIGVDVCTHESDDVKTITQHALASAREGKYNVLLIDTAGRKHIDTDMMNEIRTIHNLAKPTENLLVVDAMLGQESITIAQAFHDATALTGLVVTRIDGDARGGATLSIREATKVPVKFLGVGEKVDDLEAFQADRIARRILGMGDTLALIEKIASQSDDDDEDLTSPKELSYLTLLKQMQKIGRLGGLKKIMQLLPKNLMGKGDISPENEVLIKKKIAIILSMTPRERLEKDPLTFSRKKRIVNGSGTTIQEVNQIMKQLKTMRTMLRRLHKRNN